MKVRIVTFNYGDIAHTHDEWQRFVTDRTSVWHRFLNGDDDDSAHQRADVYAVALQEVPASSKTSLGKVLAQSLGAGYAYMYERSDSLGDFGVELHLIVSLSSVTIAPSFYGDKWSLQTRVVAHSPFFAQKLAGALTGRSTKATVGIAFDAIVSSREEEDREEEEEEGEARLRFVFLSSHLPVNTKEPVLFGLQARVDALAKAETDVVQPLLNDDGGSPDGAVVFWAGDLNFRREPVERPDGRTTDYVDQLDRLLEQQGTRPDRYREALTPRTFAPTCKYVVDKNDDAQEEQSSSLLIGTHRSLQTRRYKSSRTPSHCDRILYRVLDGGDSDSGASVSVRAVSYDAMYEHSSMRESDHAAVCAEFSVSAN